jgi:hypothetical protein
MANALLAVLLLCAPLAALAADNPKVFQLEQDVRDLQRQVQVLSRQVDELRTQLTRSGERPALRSSPAAPATTGAWLDASKWQRVRPGMNELEVIALLGPPATMREENGARVLLYAMEIGSTGFLRGSVLLRERAVVEVQKPVLQ